MANSSMEKEHSHVQILGFSMYCRLYVIYYKYGESAKLSGHILQI
jgi:hypothetical protein